MFVAPFGHVTSISVVGFHVRFTFDHIPPSIDRNLIKFGTRTCLVQMITWKLEFRKFVS